MAKLESNFKNMLLTLFVVSLCSSAAVGYVHEITREPMAATELERKIAAIQKVVPSFDNNPLEEEYTISNEKKSFRCYPAREGDRLVGTAIEAITNEGFGGRIKLMIGFLPEGAIYDITVIEHTETPGLGDKIDRKKSNFSTQFKNKNPATFRLLVKKDGGDVDAITAATISSRAFCGAVQEAYDAYQQEGNQ